MNILRRYEIPHKENREGKEVLGGCMAWMGYNGNSGAPLSSRRGSDIL